MATSTSTALGSVTFLRNFRCAPIRLEGNNPCPRENPEKLIGVSPVVAPDLEDDRRLRLEQHRQGCEPQGAGSHRRDFDWLAGGHPVLASLAVIMHSMEPEAFRDASADARYSVFRYSSTAAFSASSSATGKSWPAALLPGFVVSNHVRRSALGSFAGGAADVVISRPTRAWS